MGSDSIAFREAANLIRQGVNPKDVGDLPYIGLEHIDEGALRLTGIGNAKNVNSNKFRFHKGDILFGKLRPYFRKVIRPKFDGICSTDIWVVRSKEGFDQGYLYYWMASKDFVNFATQGSEGTKMPRAKWEHVGRFQRKRLVKSEQRAIAHILGSLDDKIELNRRMNKTLEATARAIFKSWFIDFDPVIDNALRAGNPIPESMAERAEIRRQILDQNQPSSPGPFSQRAKERNYWGGFDFSGLVETSRSLRKSHTSAEALLWDILRNRQFMGLKFRRQHQIGDYIADFYCHEHRLAVELDGGIHSKNQQKDAKCDAYMQSLGLTVLRFPNDQVFAETEGVLEKIAESTSPLPMGEGLGEGSIDEIYGLFPDSFEDLELGEIPRGWKVSTISTEFNLTMGQSPPGKTYNETGQGLPFFQGRRDFGLRYPTNRVYCTAPQRLADHGDTLVSVRAPVGDINMAMERCCVGRGVAGIRHRSGSRSYTYYAMHTLSDRFARFEGEGTVFGAINKKQFEELRWLSPGEKLVDEFEKIAFAFDEQIENNIKESITLASLRDTLLPKLISGEIRVPDVENFVEEVL